MNTLMVLVALLGASIGSLLTITLFKLSAHVKIHIIKGPEHPQKAPPSIHLTPEELQARRNALRGKGP